MSDYTNTTDGISGKGLLVAVILMGLFILGLAFMGGTGDINSPEGFTATTEAEIAPVAATD